MPGCKSQVYFFCSCSFGEPTGKGYIRKDVSKSRTIEIVDDDFNLERREITNIPIVGVVAAGEPIFADENVVGYFPVLDLKLGMKQKRRCL